MSRLRYVHRQMGKTKTTHAVSGGSSIELPNAVAAGRGGPFHLMMRSSSLATAPSANECSFHLTRRKRRQA